MPSYYFLLKFLFLFFKLRCLFIVFVHEYNLSFFLLATSGSRIMIHNSDDFRVAIKHLRDI